MTGPLRIGFVPGVIPDKWARIWREREPDSPLELVALTEDQDPRTLIDSREVDMCFVRLPIDREQLHLIPLYEEIPVVVVAKDHPVAAYDEVPLADLADEQLVLGDPPGWEQLRTATPLAFPPMSAKDAIEVVASGTGMVIAPMSIARLHSRKDVVHRPVLGVPTSDIGLAWLVANDDERLETFIGIVRGRRATSSRGNAPTAAQPRKKQKEPKDKKEPRSAGKTRSGTARAKPTAGQRRKPGARPGAARRGRR